MLACTASDASADQLSVCSVVRNPSCKSRVGAGHFVPGRSRTSRIDGPTFFLSIGRRDCGSESGGCGEGKARVDPGTATIGTVRRRGLPTVRHVPDAVLCVEASLSLRRGGRPLRSFQPAQVVTTQDAAGYGAVDLQDAGGAPQMGCSPHPSGDHPRGWRSTRQVDHRSDPRAQRIDYPDPTQAYSVGPVRASPAQRSVANRRQAGDLGRWLRRLGRKRLGRPRSLPVGVACRHSSRRRPGLGGVRGGV